MAQSVEELTLDPAVVTGLWRNVRGAVLVRAIPATLQELKERYDPDNVFRLNQNIRPRGSA